MTCAGTKFILPFIQLPPPNKQPDAAAKLLEVLRILRQTHGRFLPYPHLLVSLEHISISLDDIRVCIIYRPPVKRASLKLLVNKKKVKLSL
jgi:hypothetical protein